MLQCVRVMQISLTPFGMLQHNLWLVQMPQRTGLVVLASRTLQFPAATWSIFGLLTVSFERDDVCYRGCAYRLNADCKRPFAMAKSKFVTKWTLNDNVKTR